MADYTVQLGNTGWSDKDTYNSGNPLKVVKGTEFQNEFDAIAAAIATKYDGSQTVDINSGAIDGTTIGATTPSTGSFSSLVATTADINGGTIDGATINSTVIGGTTAAAGTFTTLTASSGITGTLSTAAQPNITSVGTLTSFACLGDISIVSATSPVTIGRGGGFIASNFAAGFRALNANTTGTYNTAIGGNALKVSTTAQSCTAVGYSAALSNTGSYNTAIGDSASYSNTSGEFNTSVGAGAGDIITTGSNNSSIGYNADPSSATASNEVTLGDTSITALRCNVTSITSLSDIRDKTNIGDLSNCSAFVKELEPVSFEWSRRDGSMQGVSAHGFIAQQLKSAQESTGHHIPGLVFEGNPDKLEAAYGNLLPTVVAALKEALVEIDTLKAKVAALESA